MKRLSAAAAFIVAFGSPASATSPDSFAPADILARAALFDGREVATRGTLLSVSDGCLSLDALGFGGGKVLISKHDAERIRAYYRETGRISLSISGTFRAQFNGAPRGTSRCGEAGLEDIVIESDSEPR